MQKIRIAQSSFHFGEVSEFTIMRRDTPIYSASAQTIRNLFPLPEGGVKRRPGLRNLFSITDITYDASVRQKARLTSFIFSDDERYLVLIENAKLRVYRVTSASVSLSATITQDADTNALPFDEDYLHEYTFAQYGDVMFICHPLFMPRMLVRTGLTSFEVQVFSFDQSVDGSFTYQPYSAFHASDVTLDPSAATHAGGGNITVTTSANYFDTTGSQTGGDYLDSKHVGAILIYGDSEMQIDSVQSATQATCTILSTYYDGASNTLLLKHRLQVINPLRTRDTDDRVEVTHIAHGLDVGDSITLYDAAATGGLTAAQINGARTIQEVIDENTYVIEADASATTSEDGGGFVTVSTHAATTLWGEQSFSELRGYPAAVVFHQNRLCFGGSIDQPDTIWMSKSGSFFNFDVGDGNDADAITMVAATGDVNEIRALVSYRDLQVFTATAEFYIPTYLNQAMTPTNAQIRKQTPYGATFVQPTPLDGAVLFTQPGGKVVREYIFTDQESAYVSTAVSTIAAHLIDDPMDLAVCHGAFGGSESIATFVKSDGNAAIFVSNRAEKRAGWFSMTTPSTYGFLSVCAIDERLFALVWDTATTAADADQTEVKLVEFDADYYLDCSKQYTPESDDEIQLAGDYQDGETVYVIGYASGSTTPVYVGTATVESYDTGGGVYSTKITVSGVYAAYATVEVGRMPTVQLVGNPVDGDLGFGPETGNPRGVSAAVLDLRDTRSVSVNTWPYNPSTAFDGKKEFFLPGYGRDPQITISQEQPLDLTLNGFMTELVV